MKNQLSCTKCEYTVTGKETKCPQCGGWIRRARRIKRLGVVLVFIGLLLVGMMSTITIMMAPMILSAGRDTGGARFTGTPEQGMMILGLFGIVIVFGLASIAGGIFQMMTGRRSIVIMVVVIGLAAVLWLVGSSLRKALDRTSIRTHENVQAWLYRPAEISRHPGQLI